MLVASPHNSGTTGVGELSPYATSPYAVLNGLYALHDELGSGGFGKVHLATHLLTSQKVAIKIIDKLKIKLLDDAYVRNFMTRGRLSLSVRLKVDKAYQAK
ncbi:unnamed protein product [Brugia timori]|uniref:Protein kinase domain-containing protein n=1 Tax=Brugia timori TaxID=42155 RepID=A0A0R3QD23_9BILA|nr:unnamed protein product [Brugia timori]